MTHMTRHNLLQGPSSCQAALCLRTLQRMALSEQHRIKAYHLMSEQHLTLLPHIPLLKLLALAVLQGNGQALRGLGLGEEATRERRRRSGGRRRKMNL